MNTGLSWTERYWLSSEDTERKLGQASVAFALEWTARIEDGEASVGTIRVQVVCVRQNRAK
jgi:hypothetical protein